MYRFMDGWIRNRNIGLSWLILRGEYMTFQTIVCAGSSFHDKLVG